MLRAFDQHKELAVVRAAHGLLGIHEVPDGSNDGPGVHRIQTSTGAYKAPWCVSTVQYVWKLVFGVTLADDTANAYHLADFANKAGWVVPRPVMGCPVVYHIGQGHAGIVEQVHPDGTFDAIEGNEGNAVRLVHRDPKAIRCTFIAPPQLYAPPSEPKPATPELISEHGRGQN